MMFKLGDTVRDTELNKIGVITEIGMHYNVGSTTKYNASMIQVFYDNLDLPIIEVETQEPLTWKPIVKHYINTSNLTHYNNPFVVKVKDTYVYSRNISHPILNNLLNRLNNV